MRHLYIVMLCTALVGMHGRASAVTLAWDPAGPEVAGYRLYYGNASRVYSNSLDVGAATSRSVLDLIPGATYFFAVTAYNSAGMESDFSTEIVYAPTLRISGVTPEDNGTSLTWTGPPGAVFRVLASPTLNNPVWQDVSGPVVALASTISWTHVRTSSDPNVFYRLEMIRPPLLGSP